MHTFEPFEPFKPTLREVLTKYSRMDDYIRQALPYLEQVELGPSTSPELRELIANLKRETA